MHNQTKLLTYSALMCAVLVVSTLWFKFTLPGTDVLFTTQVLFVLLCGQILPVRYCLLSSGLYMLLGLCGLPVFSAVSGPSVVLTPSFSYLLGFPFAAACVAIIVKRRDGLLGRVVASVAGLVVLYVVALAYIAALKALYLSSPIGFGALVTSYCLAFLPLDLVKAVLAALLGKRLEKPLRLTMANRG